jgi:tetratricopeptide (TPR) repeat protein
MMETKNSPLRISFLLPKDILACQARQYFGDADQAADSLQELQSRIPKDDPISLVSVNNALANLFLLKGDWRLALAALDRILELIPEATEAEVQLKQPHPSNSSELRALLVAAYKCEILCRQGRTLLQVGALPKVAEVFEYARSIWTAAKEKMEPDLANHPLLKLMLCQMEVNEALFYFAKSDMEHAIESFSKALERLRSQELLNQRYNADVYMGSGVVGIDTANALYSECINNLALSSLYTCRMEDAVNLLEDLVRADPTSFLTERVAFNLCTLYELGADSAVSARRKRVLQLIAKRFFLHDIGPESFRVT